MAGISCIKPSAPFAETAQPRDVNVVLRIHGEQARAQRAHDERSERERQCERRKAEVRDRIEKRVGPAGEQCVDQHEVRHGRQRILRIEAADEGQHA